MTGLALTTEENPVSDYWACYRCNGDCNEPDTYCAACQAAIDEEKR